ncbi:MAG: CcdB family protein [Halothiobacillus sp.]
MAAQLTVFAYPSGKKTHPLVVSLQSNLVDIADSVVVAPLTPAHLLANASTRLFPEVLVDGTPYRVLIPQMAAVSSRSLRDPVANLTNECAAILAAVDLLFTGI